MAEPTHALNPTGAQWVIGHGRHTAVVCEVGATLRSYSFDGQPVLDGFGPSEWSHGGRGQVLAPWPNRLGDGLYVFGDEAIQAPLNEPERATAIHGLVRWLPFKLESAHQNTLTASCRLFPSPGYPFSVRLELHYHLGRQGLSVLVRASNTGERPAPFGVGFHPYLTVGTPSVDSALLRLPASERLVADDRGLPTGERKTVEGTEFDFLTGRPIGPTHLDTAYTGLLRGQDGLARAELADPGAARVIEVWMDERFKYLMCFTGDTLGETERRRAVALEPMTCPPDAFRSGVDLLVLEPGQRFEGSWGITPR